MSWHLQSVGTADAVKAELASQVAAQPLQDAAASATRSAIVDLVKSVLDAGKGAVHWNVNAQGSVYRVSESQVQAARVAGLKDPSGESSSIHLSISGQMVS